MRRHPTRFADALSTKCLAVDNSDSDISPSWEVARLLAAERTLAGISENPDLLGDCSG
jgi:hypothetical protein